MERATTINIDDTDGVPSFENRRSVRRLRNYNNVLILRSSANPWLQK